jgi:hypothetical protein
MRRFLTAVHGGVLGLPDLRQGHAWCAAQRVDREDLLHWLQGEVVLATAGSPTEARAFFPPLDIARAHIDTRRC